MAVRWTHTCILEFLAQSLVSFEKEHRKQIDKHWSYFLIVTWSILWLNEWCHRRKASICLYEHENNISKRENNEWVQGVRKRLQCWIDSIKNGFTFRMCFFISFNFICRSSLRKTNNNRSIKLNYNGVVNRHWCMPMLPKGWSCALKSVCHLFTQLKISSDIILQFICNLLFRRILGNYDIFFFLYYQGVVQFSCRFSDNNYISIMCEWNQKRISISVSYWQLSTVIFLYRFIYIRIILAIR